MSITHPTTETSTYPAGSSLTSISHIDVRALRDEVRGDVITERDPNWDEVRQAWNLAVDQQFRAVVQVKDAADVVAAVRFARRHGFTVTAQPLGHGATHHLAGTILLRTSGLLGLSIDAERRTARVEAGVMMRDFLAAAGEHDLAPLAGSTAGVTVMGYLLGGGLSWFSRKYGFAANHVQALEMVTPAGDYVRVTADSDPDLFWAVRGGGGDFGIVTAVELELFDAPHIYGGRLMWDAEYTATVMREFRRVVENAPDELSLWVTMLQFPPVEIVPEPLRGKSVIAIDATYLGSGEEGAAYLESFRAIAQPIMDTMGTVPVSEIGEIAQEPVDPIPAVEHSHLLNDFSDRTIERLIEVSGPGSGSPLLMVQIRHLGGALARPSESHGAVGTMTEPFSLLAIGIPMVPELGPAIAARNAELSRVMAPWTTSRVFFSFLGERDIEHAYPPATLARLRTLKLQRDPASVIRSNHPILGRLGSHVPAPR